MVVRIDVIARQQVGVKETGQNGGLPFERYALPGEQPLPWCARFVRWCCGQAGVKLPGNPYLNARVENLAHAMEAVGAWRDTFPGAPCVIFYHERGHSDPGPGRHVGLVVQCDGSILETVEGNWGDQVAHRHVRLDDPLIAGFGVLETRKEGSA